MKLYCLIWAGDFALNILKEHTPGLLGPWSQSKEVLFCLETDLKSAAIGSDKQSVENSALSWSFTCLI